MRRRRPIDVKPISILAVGLFVIGLANIDPNFNSSQAKGDKRTAHFYTVVTRDTVDADFAAHRQRFLAEQGYAYRIVDADDL